MTTDIKQLPLPSVLLNWPHPTNHVAIRDYARAVAEYNVKERDAEIEALRAEVGTATRMHAITRGHLEAAEALRRAEVLLLSAGIIAESDLERPHSIATEIKNALRDHDQEGHNG